MRWAKRKHANLDDLDDMDPDTTVHLSASAVKGLRDTIWDLELRVLELENRCVKLERLHAGSEQPTEVM